MATIQEQLKQFNEIVKRRGALPAPKPAPTPKPKTPQQEFLGAVSGYEPKAGKPSYTQQRQRTKGTLENDMVQVDSELGNNPKLRGIIRKVLYNARATGDYNESQLSEIRSNAVKMARSGKTANLEAFVKETDKIVSDKLKAFEKRAVKREDLRAEQRYLQGGGGQKEDIYADLKRNDAVLAAGALSPFLFSPENLSTAAAMTKPGEGEADLAGRMLAQGLQEIASNVRRPITRDVRSAVELPTGASELEQFLNFAAPYAIPGAGGIGGALARGLVTDLPSIAYGVKDAGGPSGFVQQMAGAGAGVSDPRLSGQEQFASLLAGLGSVLQVAGAPALAHHAYQGVKGMRQPVPREPFFTPKADPTYGPDVPLDLVGMQKRRQRALPGRSPESIAESGLQGFESQSQKALPAPKTPKALNSRTAKSDLTYTDPWTGIAEPKASPSGKAIQSHDNGQPYYHGHRTTVKPMEMANIDGEAWDSNLFGAGLYLTDDPGVAKRYAKAGTTKGYIAEGSKILDLNKPLPEDAAVAIEKALGLKVSRDTSGAVAFKEILIDGRDSGNFDHANQVKGIISDALNRAGYDGLTHKANRRGGWREGNNGATNNVVVLFDPRKTLKNAPAKPKPAEGAGTHKPLTESPGVVAKSVETGAKGRPGVIYHFKMKGGEMEISREIPGYLVGKSWIIPDELRHLWDSDNFVAKNGYKSWQNKLIKYFEMPESKYREMMQKREIAIRNKSKTPVWSDPDGDIVSGANAYRNAQSKRYWEPLNESAKREVAKAEKTARRESEPRWPRTPKELLGRPIYVFATKGDKKIPVAGPFHTHQDAIGAKPEILNRLRQQYRDFGWRDTGLSYGASKDNAPIKVLYDDLRSEGQNPFSAKPKPAKFEPKADPNYQDGDVPDIRKGLKPVQKPAATQKEPWHMTLEEVESLTESDFNKADKILAKQYGDLFWKVYGKADGEATLEQVSMYKMVESASDIFREVGAKHQAAWDARAGEFEKLIKSGESYKVPQRGFMNYHKTGDIASGAYDRLTGEGGMNFVKKERFSELVDTINTNGKKIEIRVEKEPAKYVKTDERDEVVRDADGKAVYLSDEELAKKGLSPWSITIGAFDGDKAIGYSGDEFGATGVYVADGYQKHGIGSRLMHEYLVRSGRLNKGYRIGQMTSAGYKTVQAVHKRIVQKALSEGKPVPPEVLADYPDLAPKPAPKPRPSQGTGTAKPTTEAPRLVANRVAPEKSTKLKPNAELAAVQKTVKSQISERAPFWQQRAKTGGEIGPNGEHYKGGQFIARFPETVKGAKAKLDKSVASNKGYRQRNNLSDSEVVLSAPGAGYDVMPVSKDRWYNGPIKVTDTRSPDFDAYGNRLSDSDIKRRDDAISWWNGLVERVDAGDPGFRWLNDRGEGKLVVDSDIHPDYVTGSIIGERYVLKGLPIPDHLVSVAKDVLPGIDIDRYQALAKRFSGGDLNPQSKPRPSQGTGTAKPTTEAPRLLANRKKGGGKEPWQMTREEFRTSTATRTEASRSVSFTEWAKSRGLKVGSDYASDPQFAEYIGRSVFPTSNTTTKSQTGKTNGLRKLVDARTRLLKQWEAETLTIEKQVPLSDTERDAAYVRAMHKREIRKALAEGKPVPPEVLADYPDLAPKPKPKPAEVSQPAKVGTEAAANRIAPEKSPDPVIRDAHRVPSNGKDLPAEWAKEKVSSQTGLRPSQAKYLGERLNEGSDKLPIETPHNLWPTEHENKLQDGLAGEKARYKEIAAKYAENRRNARKQVIKVPGDGEWTVYSQSQARELVKAIGFNKEKTVRKPAWIKNSQPVYFEGWSGTGHMMFKGDPKIEGAKSPMSPETFQKLIPNEITSAAKSVEHLADSDGKFSDELRVTFDDDTSVRVAKQYLDEGIKRNLKIVRGSSDDVIAFASDNGEIIGILAVRKSKWEPSGSVPYKKFKPAAPTKAQAVQKIKDGLKKFGDIDPDGPHKAGAGWVPFTEGQIEGLKMVAEGAWELAKISGKSAMDHAFQTMKSHWSPTMQKWFEDEFKRRTTAKPERAANKPTEAVETPTKKDAVPTPAKEAKAPPTNQKVPPAQASQAYAETLRKNLGLPDITKGKKTLASMVESPRAKEVDANAASFAREWLNDTKRPITDEETAGLARAMNRLDADTKRIQNEHMAAIERGDTDGAARLDAQLSIVLDDLNDITRVVHRTGTEWGLSGVARRLQLQKDYSTGGLTYRLSKAVKRKASAIELKEAAGHAQSVADAEIQFNKKVEEAVAARLKGMRSAPRAKGNRIFTEDRYKAAVDRINRAARGEEVRMAAGLDPQAMSDLITIVGYHVESGIRTLPELLGKAKELGLDKADERDVALATHQVLSEMDATRAQVESKKATLATLRKEVKDIVDPSILEKVNAKIAEIDAEPMANHPKEYWQSRYNDVNGLLRELNRGKGIGEDVYARFEDAIQDPEVSKARIALQRRKADAEAWLNAKEWESQSGLRKAYELAVEAVNIPRVVLASGDLSAPGRQGLILLLANPKRSVAAFRDQFRAISKAGAEKVLDGIMTEKRYDLARDAKLAIMDVTHSGLFPTEDQFISRFAGKLPIVAQSDRAYSAFLSRIRMDWFTHMVDALEKSGQPVSLKEAKEIAGFVNIATGRGNLGKFETHGNTLAKLMFSARYNWSRIQYLTGTPIWKSKSKRVQREILKTYGQTALGYAGLAAALTYGLGLSIGNDPTRGDIGRAIEGIRRYDITSGLSQYITLGARLFEGLVGNIREDENQIKRGMSFDKGKRLIRGKLTPTLGIATDFSINQGKDMFTGKKMGFWDVARKLLLPIGVSQIIENKMEGKPMSDTAKESTAEFFGIGARTWDTLPSSKKKVPPPKKQEPAYIPY